MRKVFIFFIKVYQAAISPFLGKRCRFYPSCSQYSLDAFNQYGTVKGAGLTVKRLLKCGPWHPGGIDHLRSTL